MYVFVYVYMYNVTLGYDGQDPPPVVRKHLAIPEKGGERDDRSPWEFLTRNR